MAGNIVHGAAYLGRGARMLRHPSLRLFVIVPLLVNFLIFASLLTVGFSYVTDLMAWLDASLPQWLDFLRWILWPLIIVTALLLSGYLFTFIAVLIASPFNGLLAEKAEELITGRPVDALEGLRAALVMVPRGIVREILKLLYYAPIALGVFLLTLIPGINAVAPLLWFLLGAWMMSIQFVDYPMDNHQRSFAEVKVAVRTRRLSSLGFGGLVALVAGIPVLNFFVMPAAVVGATLFWCEELSPQPLGE